MTDMSARRIMNSGYVGGMTEISTDCNIIHWKMDIPVNEGKVNDEHGMI
jgi:hypothetical protein